jgi:hypothetical protein
MITCHREPTLAETLSDPLIQVVMAADGVQPTEIEDIMQSIFQNASKRRRRMNALIPRTYNRLGFERHSRSSVMLTFIIIGAVGVLLFLAPLVTGQSQAGR